MPKAFLISMFMLTLYSCDISETKIAKYFTEERNVLNKPLQLCCAEPMTGYFRDGFCRKKRERHVSHTICSKMTDAFLEFSKERGNDLTKKIPNSSFPGLKQGDVWCLDIYRWKEAHEEGLAPPVYLNSCHFSILKIVALDTLKSYAIDL